MFFIANLGWVNEENEIDSVSKARRLRLSPDILTFNAAIITSNISEMCPCGLNLESPRSVREFKHDVYGKRQTLPLTFYSFLVLLK